MDLIHPSPSDSLKVFVDDGKEIISVWDEHDSQLDSIPLLSNLTKVDLLVPDDQSLASPRPNLKEDRPPPLVHGMEALHIIKSIIFQYPRALRLHSLQDDRPPIDLKLFTGRPIIDRMEIEYRKVIRRTYPQPHSPWPIHVLKVKRGDLLKGEDAPDSNHEPNDDQEKNNFLFQRLAQPFSGFTGSKTSF